jgi:hypothetical protein
VASGTPPGQAKASTSKKAQEQEIIPPTSAEFLNFLQTTSSDEEDSPITGIILRFHQVFKCYLLVLQYVIVFVVLIKKFSSKMPNCYCVLFSNEKLIRLLKLFKKIIKIAINVLYGGSAVN